MTDTSQNNKRIAKNTLLLYFRMLLLMLVTLYTSRVVINKLGVTDFGIYNVVGGIVSMLGFLTSAMANAVQRFLSFEIGKGNSERINHIFNVSLMAHYCIAVFVLFVMEVAGVWYLNYYMNIPAERLNAANWVLQCSIFTAMFSIIQVPYNAIIISKEQMGVYAYISILEAILKLAIVYLLSICSFDRLKFYSVLVMVVTIGILMAYRIFCIKKYEEAKFKFIKDIKTLKEITKFAGWNMLGELAWVFTGQGVNIILNIFFGPAVNAARGLAEQVNGAVMKFINGFQTAVNPQLIKSYAVGQFEEMRQLLFRNIRFSFYLMFVLALPLILDMDFVLKLWLMDVPEFAVGFCRLILICSLVATLSNPLSQVARAYGDMRKYQIVVSIVLFLNFPLSYFVLKAGASPLMTIVVNIIVQGTLLFVRLYLVKSMINLSILDFIIKVLYPILKVLVPTLILIYLCTYESGGGWQWFVFIVCISLICSVSSILIFGVSKHERAYIISFAKKFFKKNKS